MSKAPPQTTAKKWTSQRILARVEDSSNRKASTVAPVSHEHSTPPPPTTTTTVQLPPSLFFERQEAVDALSNLFHNTETVKKIEMGPPVFEPRDSSRFHSDLLECLKSAGLA